MFDVGFWELFLIALILLIVLGPERLPQVARTAGRYMRKIKTFSSQMQHEFSTEFEMQEEQLSIKKEIDDIKKISQESTAQITNNKRPK